VDLVVRARDGRAPGAGPVEVVVDVELDAPETRVFEAPVAEIVRGHLAHLDILRDELLAERLGVF